MGIEAEVVYDTPLELKRFFLSKKKYSREVAYDFGNELDNAMRAWEDEVRGALSDYYPDWKKALRRPEADFPHANRGNLRDSVFSQVRTKVTQKNVSFSTLVGIGAEHGLHTSKGHKERKDLSTPDWFGWQDRIFKEASGDVQTVTELFDWLHTLRTQL